MMNVIFRVGMIILVLTCGSVNATPSFNCKVPGVAGGLWQDGQSPLNGDSYPASQARQRLAVLAQATDTIRLYDAEDDLEAACIARKEFGMNVFLGIWIDSDVITNNAQITSGITAAQNGCVDALIIGNEVLLRGDQSPGYLAETILSVVPHTNVCTVWGRGRSPRQ